MRCNPRRGGETPGGCPSGARKQPLQNRNLSSTTRASSSGGHHGTSTWNRFVTHHSRDEGIELSAHLLYDAKFFGTSRRLGVLATQAKGADQTGNLEYQKARSNVRAVFAEVVAYGQLRRDFLVALNTQLGEVSLVSGVEVTGTKIPALKKRWTDLAPFSLIRFERAKKPKGEVMGVARHFAQIALKTCANPGESIKKGVEQFRYRDERYWGQGGQIRYLGGGNQGFWIPEFADDLPQSRWIMLSGKELPPTGEPYKDRFFLVPLAASASQLDTAVDEVIQEISATS